MLTVKAPDRARRYGLKPTKACQSWSRGSVTWFESGREFQIQQEKNMTMIQYQCKTNVDLWRGATWPTHFPQVPNVGDMIEGSCQGKTPRLRVSSICYKLGDLVKQGTIVEIWLDNVRL